MSVELSEQVLKFPNLKMEMKASIRKKQSTQNTLLWLNSSSAPLKIPPIPEPINWHELYNPMTVPFIRVLGCRETAAGSTGEITQCPA